MSFRTVGREANTGIIHAHSANTMHDKDLYRTLSSDDWPSAHMMAYTRKVFPNVVQDYKGFSPVAFHIKSRIRLIIV